MRTLYPLVLITSIMMTSNLVAETTVFKSTDPDGHVSYGDKPSQKAVDFELIEIKQAIEISDTDLDKRLERMAATTKRLQEDRKERELKREEEKQSETTIVYYPAADPGHTHYSRTTAYGTSGYRNYRRARRIHNKFHDDGNTPVTAQPYSSYSSGYYHRESSPLSVGLGFRSSGFSGSLQVGSQSSSSTRKTSNSRYEQPLSYSPLLKSR